MSHRRNDALKWAWAFIEMVFIVGIGVLVLLFGAAALAIIFKLTS